MYTCAGRSTPRQPTAWLRPASQRMDGLAAWWSAQLPGCQSPRQRWVLRNPSGTLVGERVAARLSQSHEEADSDKPLAPFSLSGRGCPSLRHDLVFHRASGTSGGILVKHAAARLTQSQAETRVLKAP